MAKNTFGKLIAFTTAVAAVGGICYVFRDRIKESPLFKSASGKANDIYDNVKSKINKEDDFFFDDWDDDFNDDFDDDTAALDESTAREYTSLTSTANSPSEEDVSDDNKTDSSTDEQPETIPTIDFGASNISEKSDSISPDQYENEGLSDTSEDPDVLEEQDKLDF